jgi:prepilin-type N-terminal cleavage/methylation domain-containing protein
MPRVMHKRYHLIVNQNNQRRSFAVGFTVVELLIVIVVIAILAAITVVAYRGVTQQAAEIALKSDLQDAVAELHRIQLREGSFPATIDEVQKSDGTVFDYVHTSKVFCLTATNPSYEGMAYYITQDDMSRLALIDIECQNQLQ